MTCNVIKLLAKLMSLRISVKSIQQASVTLRHTSSYSGGLQGELACPAGFSFCIARQRRTLKYVLRMRPRENQAGDDTSLITDFALPLYKCLVW